MAAARIARLYVSNLPWTIGHRQLREYFAQFGPVQSAKVVFDTATGLSKGYGFVEFQNKSAIDDANNKQSHILEGVKLTVKTAHSN